VNLKPGPKEKKIREMLSAEEQKGKGGKEGERERKHREEIFVGNSRLNDNVVRGRNTERMI